VGLNVTDAVQDAPGRRVLVQLPAVVAKGLKVVAARVADSLPEFVITTVCVALDPVVIDPNAIDAADTLRDAAVPVPDRLTTCDPAPSSTVSEPVMAPATVGLN
jgi:hypothetical protein